MTGEPQTSRRLKSFLAIIKWDLCNLEKGTTTFLMKAVDGRPSDWDVGWGLIGQSCNVVWNITPPVYVYLYRKSVSNIY